MQYDYVNKNLADFITVDSLKPQKEKIPFTVAEINKLWKYLYTNRFDDIPLILLYSGMRISELLELKTENVDLKNKTINVIKSKTAAGENEWNLINEFLEKHQEYYLSDLLYNQAVYKTYEKWKNRQ